MHSSVHIKLSEYIILLLAGIPIRYGEPPVIVRQRKSVIFKRTKPNRDPNLSSKKRKRDDGERPPDTLKELSATKQKAARRKVFQPKRKPTTRRKVVAHRKKAESSSDSHEDSPGSGKDSDSDNVIKSDDSELKELTSYVSYSWVRNSCWLDSSMELVNSSVSQTNESFDEFVVAFADLEPVPSPEDGGGLREFFSALQGRSKMSNPTSQMLNVTRDAVRDRLSREGSLWDSKYSGQAVWVRFF